MASNFKKSATLRNAQMDAITTAIGASGLLKIYDGTQPASVATAVGAQVLLVTCTLNATFAPAASAGVLTANAITGANATGTTATGASWFRIFKSDGTTAVCDGSVGTSAADCIIQNVMINAGQAISVTSLTVTASGA